jgi:KDO2-lipid IV(A) lauroyltransferase
MTGEDTPRVSASEDPPRPPGARAVTPVPKQTVTVVATEKAHEARRATLADRIQYATARAAIAALSKLSWRAASAAGGALARLAYSPLRIRRGVVVKQIAAALPDHDQKAQRRIASGSYVNLGRVAAETAIAPAHIALDNLDSLFHPPLGWEHLSEHASRGEGVILVSGHLGNWEIGAAYMAARGLDVSAVVRRMSNPLFDGYINRARRRLGWNVIYDADAPRQVPRAIRAGHVVPLLADQGVKGLSSTFVPFFGRLARTPRGPAVFALRLKAPCVLGMMPREPDGRYRLCIEPIPVIDTGHRERDIDAIVAAYTAQLESWVRRYPDQYMWQHRRWRRRPGGETEEF